MKKIFFLGILMLLSVLVAGCSGNNTAGSAVSGDVVTIPLSDLSSTVKFYTHEDAGVNIKYFAVLGTDGNPRTAFDACDVCGGYQGYVQQGNDIMCRKCGRVFSIDGLGTKNKGYGCWPSYLPHEVKDGNLLIKVSNIKSGRHRFA